jgi:hypothetical protein
MQKIIFCGSDDPETSSVRLRDVQALLDEGYTVESVTPQHCAISTGTGYTRKAFGGFVVVLNAPEVSL